MPRNTDAPGLGTPRREDNRESNASVAQRAAAALDRYYARQERAFLEAAASGPFNPEVSAALDAVLDCEERTE
jgi:hypothetical protein